MQSGIRQGEDGAPGVTQRVFRLLVLLGVGVAAYLVLSLFDHAARADTGSINHLSATDSVNPVKAAAAGVLKAAPQSKSAAPKAHAPKVDLPTIKASTHPPKVQASKKTHAPKMQAPRKAQALSTRTGETAHRVQAKTSKLRQHASDAVRAIVRAPVTKVRTVAVQLKSAIPALPALAELPVLRQVQLPALSPQAQPLALPQALALPQTQTQVSTRTAALVGAVVPHQSLVPVPSALVCLVLQQSAFAPASGLSGVTTPPAAQAQPRTAPLPAPPRQPADRSTPAGQARESGGGNAPAMGTVASSWRPELTAAGRRLATALPARGRTVRYAGPPS
jgi:hypothetical protein